jgi:hypothetical protein
MVLIQSVPGGLSTNGQSIENRMALDAHLHHAAQQCRIGEVAAGGDPEMLAKHIAETESAGCPGATAPD